MTSDHGNAFPITGLCEGNPLVTSALISLCEENPLVSNGLPWRGPLLPGEGACVYILLLVSSVFSIYSMWTQSVTRISILTLADGYPNSTSLSCIPFGPRLCTFFVSWRWYSKSNLVPVWSTWHCLGTPRSMTSILVWIQGGVSIRKTVLPGMAIPMLKIRRPNGRLIFNMEIAIRR